jgi:hypothetical protein
LLKAGISLYEVAVLLGNDAHLGRRAVDVIKGLNGKRAAA